MKITKTLGPKTSVLFTKLHDQDQLVFDLNTAAKMMGVDRAHAVGILHAATKRGLITPIKRGLYNLVPFEMGSVDFHLTNRYAIVAASMEGKPYFFSHVSALDLHGLVTQPSFDVYVSSLRRLAPRNLGGARVHFVSVRNVQFFGFGLHDLGNKHQVFVSDLERSLIDGFCSFWLLRRVGRSRESDFMAKSRINLDKLVDYAHRMKMASIIRRLGFVLEILGLVDEALTSKLKAGLPAGAVQLDHDLPITGKHDAKWGLRLNVSAEEILKAVSN